MAARLPTRDDLGAMPSARTGRAMATIRPSVADTSAVGRGMQGFGNAVARLGTTLGSIQEQADEFDTERRFQEFKYNQVKALDEQMRAVQPGQAGKFADDWTNSYTENARSFFETVPEHLKAKYDAKLFDTERDFYGTAATFGRNEQKRYSIQSLDEHKNRLATTGDIDRAKKDYDDLLATNPYLTPIEKDEIRRKGLGDLEEGYIRWRLERGEDVDEIIRDLETPPAPESRAPVGPLPPIKDVTEYSAPARPRKGPIEGVVIHHTAGSSAEGALAHGEKTGTGTNYYIDRDGSILRWAPEDQRLSHIRETGDRRRTKGAWDHLGNDNTIGIEVIAKNDKDVTPEQRQALQALLGDIVTRNKLDPKNVVGHGEIQGGPTGNREATEGRASAEEIRTGRASLPVLTEGPTPVSRRGLTQYAGLKGETASDALPEETKVSRYGYLSAEQRTRLLNSAKNARDQALQSRLWELKQQADDDVESRRKTGQGRQGFELDAFSKVADPSVVNNYVTRAREADMEYAGGAGLDEMDDGEITSHLESLVPEPGSADYEMKAKVYDKVKKRADGIRELRAQDPAAAVDQLPEVQNVAKRLAETGIQDQGAIVKARLDAQEKLGIPEQDRLPITKAEAKALLDLPAQRWNLNEKDYITKLRAAADRAEQTYGPLMARRVFETAVGLDLKDRTGTDAAAGVASKMARGEAVTADDFRRMTALQEIDQVSRTFDATLRPDMGETGDRPAISPMFGQENLDFTTRYAAEQAGKKPNPAQEAWIVENAADEGAIREFDLRFGRGASATAISRAQKASGKPKK